MSTASLPLTMFDKIWRDHVVVPETCDTPAVLYVDMHFTHEVTSPVAFSLLRAKNLPVRRPDRTLATMDHSTPTTAVTDATDAAASQMLKLEANAKRFGVELFDMSDARRGIVHVIGPELGMTQPGMTIVCGDSHTSTHGAFGALAFGIGTTEVAHVFATQCLLQRKPKTFEVRVDGALAPGVTAKDLILGLIGKIGVSGGTGHVIEYTGSTIRALSMEQRMTVCNMSIEAGARAGMIAPDDTTFAFLADRPRAPRGTRFDLEVRWKSLVTDAGAPFDAGVSIDASALEPLSDRPRPGRPRSLSTGAGRPARGPAARLHHLDHHPNRRKDERLEVSADPQCHPHTQAVETHPLRGTG
jgi:3-isopropylmalate/(R)-2-methylmalate dehydratase large subunit